MFYRTSVSGPNGCFIIISRSFQPLTYWDFVKQVAIDVERDEDESGTFGETSIDYVRVYVSFIFMKKERAALCFLGPFLFSVLLLLLRNLHIPILFPETSQAISWSSSS